MPLLICDPGLEARIIADRASKGGDHHDEVWCGVYFIPPLPDNEHQEFVGELSGLLFHVVGNTGLGKVRPGVNLSPLAIDDWKYDFRVPDVVAFTNNTKAETHDTHWRGPADFLVEIVGPHDRTYEKLPFCGRLGVRELLIVDRDPWKLELYRHHDGELRLVGRSTVDDSQPLPSEVVPLTFRLIAGVPRPQIEVMASDPPRQWQI